jgi:DNA-binding CsgD family transcriptional regulator
MDFCSAAAVSAPSFAPMSFTPDKRQQNTAESLTLTWKSQFVQAVGYGWICQPWSSKMAELTRASSCICPAISQIRKHNEELLHKMLQLSKQIIAVSEGNGGGRLAPVSSLSEQEQNVLHLFSDGKNSAEIARELGISLQTLRNHLYHVNDKLGTHNRLQAVMHAMHRKLI